MKTEIETLRDKAEREGKERREERKKKKKKKKRKERYWGEAAKLEKEMKSRVFFLLFAYVGRGRADTRGEKILYL
jgi:hypothetical protein